MFRAIMNFWRAHATFVFSFICLQVISVVPAVAGTTVFSALSGTCNFYQSSTVYAQRYIAGYSGTISAINVLENASAQSTYSGAFATSKYFVMADNGNSAPTTIIDTLTAETLTSTYARYIGSASVVAGQKFWIIPGQQFSVFPACYFYPGSLPNGFVTSSNGWSLDTSSATTWAYGTGVSPTSLNTVGYATHLFAISIEVGNPTPISIALSLQGGGNTATYRTQKVIRANLSIDAKVTFFQGGKLIAGCKNVQSSSLVANCPWLPSIHGPAQITASAITLSSGYTKGYSSPFTIGVEKRTNNR